MGGLEPPAYYQRSLCAILRGALETHTNVLLAEEVESVLRVLALPPNAQRLLFRLHLRRHAWLRVGTDIDYADVPNTPEAVRVLVRSGFVHLLPHPAASSLTQACKCTADVDASLAWLDALRVPELRKLCTAMNIRAPAASSRPAILDTLLAPCDSRQKRLPFAVLSNPHTARNSDQLDGIDNTCTHQTMNEHCFDKGVLHGAQIAHKNASLVSIDSSDTLPIHVAVTVKEVGVDRAHRARIAEQAFKVAGEPLVRQCACMRVIVTRLASLHLLTFDVLAADEDKPGAGVSAALSAAVLADLQRVAYAPYSVVRTRPLFLTRDDLLAYENAAARLARVQQDPNADGAAAAAQLLAESSTAVLSKSSLLNDRSCADSPIADLFRWIQCVEDCARDARPYFLRRFTAGWLLTRVIDEHVSALEAAHQWPQACVLLRALLGQLAFCRRQRARWWERLVIDAASHRGEVSAAVGANSVALAILSSALADEHVRGGLRHSFVRRLSRMSAASAVVSASSLSKRNELPSLTDLWDDFSVPPLHTTPGDEKVAAAQNQIERPKSRKRRSALDKESDVDEDLQCEAGVEIETVRAEPVRMRVQGVTRLLYARPELGVDACSVEQLAIAHYAAEGRWEGVHCEGSLWSTLFGILLWEAIFFADIPDVFQGLCQDAPLDLRTDCFYPARKALIKKRLAEIASATPSDVCALVSECHAAFVGVRAAGVHWESFPLRTLVAVCRATPPRALSSILNTIATEYHGGPPSGMPDLFLYRERPGVLPECIFVEVKSTFDRLSDKQRFWQTILVGLGLRCIVCHVTER